MVETKTCRQQDLPAFRRLHNTYVGREETIETVREWYRAHPELLVGAYVEDELVGHCLGIPRSDVEVEIAGIGIEPDYRRQGVGSALLSACENRVISLGYQRISVGSAGGYVDEFYLANGYAPESVLVRLDAEDVPVNYRAMGYEITKERTDNGTKKLYVAVDEYDPERVRKIREAFDDPEAIFIMSKELSGR